MIVQGIAQGRPLSNQRATFSLMSHSSFTLLCSIPNAFTKLGISVVELLHLFDWLFKVPRSR